MAEIGHRLEDGACDLFGGRFACLCSAAVIVLAREHVDRTNLGVDRFDSPSSVPACARSTRVSRTSQENDQPSCLTVSIASYRVLTFEVELEISWKDVQALHSGTQRE